MANQKTFELSKHSNFNLECFGVLARISETALSPVFYFARVLAIVKKLSQVIRSKEEESRVED